MPANKAARLPFAQWKYHLELQYEKGDYSRSVKMTLFCFQCAMTDILLENLINKRNLIDSLRDLFRLYFSIYIDILFRDRTYSSPCTYLSFWNW